MDSKTERVKRLLIGTDLPTEEIARQVGCAASLVRTVRGRLAPGRRSTAQRVAELEARVDGLERAVFRRRQGKTD